MLALTLRGLAGLPEDELATRIEQHRGVYCRPGLLVPSDSTLYHLTAAQHFNSLLPLGPDRHYTSPDFGQSGGVLCAWDTETLLALANELPDKAADGRFYYVLQIEVDLLLSPVTAEPGWEGAPRALGSRVRVGGAGVNEMAITRVWLAKRDPDSGAFTCVAPPNGKKGA